MFVKSYPRARLMRGHLLAGLVGAMLLMVPVLSGLSGVRAASIGMMEGETLDKKDVTYPKDFDGKQTVMVMLFDQDQQSQLDGWAAGMADLPDGVAMIEVALIGKVNGMVKYFIKGGMRDNIEDDPARMARMMPYFGDADKVKKRLKITDISEVQAFLLSPSGKVLWQASGDYDGQFKQMPTGQ